MSSRLLSCVRGWMKARLTVPAPALGSTISVSEPSQPLSYQGPVRSRVSPVWRECCAVQRSEAVGIERKDVRPVLQQQLHTRVVPACRSRRTAMRSRRHRIEGEGGSGGGGGGLRRSRRLN